MRVKFCHLIEMFVFFLKLLLNLDKSGIFNSIGTFFFFSVHILKRIFARKVDNLIKHFSVHTMQLEILLKNLETKE